MKDIRSPIKGYTSEPGSVGFGQCIYSGPVTWYLALSTTFVIQSYEFGHK